MVSRCASGCAAAGATRRARGSRRRAPRAGCRRIAGGCRRTRLVVRRVARRRVRAGSRLVRVRFRAGISAPSRFARTTRAARSRFAAGNRCLAGDRRLAIRPQRHVAPRIHPRLAHAPESTSRYNRPIGHRCHGGGRTSPGSGLGGHRRPDFPTNVPHGDRIDDLGGETPRLCRLRRRTLVTFVLAADICCAGARGSDEASVPARHRVLGRALALGPRAGAMAWRRGRSRGHERTPRRGCGGRRAPRPGWSPRGHPPTSRPARPCRSGTASG